MSVKEEAQKEIKKWERIRAISLREGSNTTQYEQDYISKQIEKQKERIKNEPV